MSQPRDIGLLPSVCAQISEGNYMSWNQKRQTRAIGFSDADWAGDQNDRRSISGYIFRVGSGPISWKSKKQDCVALSTAEAEYVALSSATQESIWLRKLFTELGNPLEGPTAIINQLLL